MNVSSNNYIIVQVQYKNSPKTNNNLMYHTAKMNIMMNLSKTWYWAMLQLVIPSSFYAEMNLLQL